MSDENQNDQEEQNQNDEQLGDAGKKALEAERAAKREAEKRARDAEKRAADLEAEAKKRAEDEAAEQGKFRELATTREAELTEATNKLTTTQAERDALAEYVKSDIAAVTKTVKDAKDSPAAKALMRFYPGDDADPLTLLDWAKEAKALLPEITTKQSPRGNGQDPKPGGGSKEEIPSPLPKNQYM